MTENKKIHNMKDSLELGNLGTYILSKYYELGVITSSEGNQLEFSQTKPGGVKDKKYKIDGYLLDKSVQVKIDLQACFTGNVALEVSEQRFLGGIIQPPRAGALLQEKILDVDYLVYVIPGHGVAFWKPRTMAQLLWYWQSHYNEWDSRKWQGSFYYKNAVNENGRGNDWLSLNYHVPTKFIMYSEEDYNYDLVLGREPLEYKCYYNYRDKKQEYLPKTGAIKSYTWFEFLSIMQTKQPAEYENIVKFATQYANSFKDKNKTKAMYEAWGQTYEQYNTGIY